MPKLTSKNIEDFLHEVGKLGYRLNNLYQRVPDGKWTANVRDNTGLTHTYGSGDSALAALHDAYYKAEKANNPEPPEGGLFD